MDEQDNPTMTAGEEAAMRDEPTPEAPQEEQPAPEAEAAPEPADAEEPVDADGKPAKTFVPYGELRRERNRRQELEAKQREAELFRVRAEERLNFLAQRLQEQIAPPTPPQQLASIDEAPIDHIKAQAREIENFKAWQREQQQQAQHVGAVQQFEHAVNTAEAAFAAKTPDYLDAISWLRESRQSELADLGYSAADQSRIIMDEIRGISHNILQQGGNPAENFYKVALRRGFKRTAGNGADKLQTIERGQQAGRSLSQAAGAAPSGKLSLERLVQMDDDEFAKMSERDWRKAMGG